MVLGSGFPMPSTVTSLLLTPMMRFQWRLELKVGQRGAVVIIISRLHYPMYLLDNGVWKYSYQLIHLCTVTKKLLCSSNFWWQMSSAPGSYFGKHNQLYSFIWEVPRTKQEQFFGPLWLCNGNDCFRTSQSVVTKCSPDSESKNLVPTKCLSRTPHAMQMNPANHIKDATEDS